MALNRDEPHERSMETAADSPVLNFSNDKGQLQSKLFLEKWKKYMKNDGGHYQSELFRKNTDKCLKGRRYNALNCRVCILQALFMPSFGVSELMKYCTDHPHR